MPHVLLATRNAGKIREIRQIAAELPVVWYGLDDFPPVPEPNEHGATFAENARLKALYYCEQHGGRRDLAVLADDSGLEVDAVGGAPGVHSARYAGTPRDDAANNRKLVQALSGLPRERRTARFHCAMALAHGHRVVIETQGTFEGQIIDQPRGTNGFGYDPHFLVPALERTVAELPAEQKNALSHRGQALRAMLAQMEAWYRARGLWGG